MGKLLTIKCLYHFRSLRLLITSEALSQKQQYRLYCMEVPPFNLLHTRKMNFGFLASPSLRWIDPSGDYWMCRERVALAEVSCCAWKAAVFDHYNVIYFLLQSEGWNPHDYSCISNPLWKQVGSTYTSTNWSTFGPKKEVKVHKLLIILWPGLNSNWCSWYKNVVLHW